MEYDLSELYEFLTFISMTGQEPQTSTEVAEALNKVRPADVDYEMWVLAIAGVLFLAVMTGVEEIRTNEGTVLVFWDEYDQGFYTYVVNEPQDSEDVPLSDAGDR